MGTFSRRPGGRFNRGRLAFGAGVTSVSPGTPLLDPTTAQFDRVSSATYLTSATTVAVVGGDVLRLEDRGDGFGPLPLFERGITQWLDVTEGANFLLSPGQWSALGGATASPANAVAPDGNTTASTLHHAANINSAMRRAYSNPNPPPSAVVSYSVWYKQGTSPFNSYAGYIDKDTTTFRIVGLTGSSAWQRADISAVTLSALTGVLNVDYQTITAVAHDFVLWGQQLETGSYPTSYYPNAGGGGLGQRFPDVLQYLPAQVPQYLRAFAWQVPVFPLYANTDLLDGDERWLFSFGDANNGVRIRRAAGATKVEALVGGVVQAASAALTFARQASLVVKSDGPNGLISVNGSAGPAGTPYVFPGGVPLRQGGIVALSNELDGRMGTVIAQ